MRLGIFLYCSEDFNQSIRCINSILRQKNPNIDLQLVFDDEESKNKVLKAIAPFNPYCILKNGRTNKAAFLELIEATTADYFMIALCNQVFAMNCFNSVLASLGNYDGAIVNYACIKNNKPSKVYGKITYTTFFNKAPYCYNLIYKTKIFKLNHAYFNLNYDQQPFFVANYFSYAKDILFCNDVFYYKNAPLAKRAFNTEIDINEMSRIARLISRLKKSGKKECAVNLMVLYFDRIIALKQQPLSLKHKLKYWYYSKKLGNSLF